MVHNSIMSHPKNTILCCLYLLAMCLFTQCTSTSNENESEQAADELTSIDDLPCLVGGFDLFSTTIDSADFPVFGEQNIDMKCRWNEDGTIIRNTSGIEQRGSWSVIQDSLLVVRIDSLYETKGSFILESPAYDTSIIKQCDDTHLVLTSSSNGFTSTITWIRQPE